MTIEHLVRYLTIHIKIVNEEVKSDYNQYDYKTTGQGYLAIHLKLVNKELKSDCNQCDQCEYRFDQKKLI